MLSTVTSLKSTAFRGDGPKIALVQLMHTRLCSHFKSCDPANENAEVKAYARMILCQKIEVLNLVSNDDYTRKVPLSSTIGAHMRHSLDHITVVLNANAENTILDYDSRERNTATELIRANALKICNDLLTKLNDSNFDDPVTVKFISNPVTGKKLSLPFVHT